MALNLMNLDNTSFRNKWVTPAPTGGKVIREIKRANQFARDRGEEVSDTQTVTFTIIVTSISQFLVLLLIEIVVIIVFGLQYYPGASVWLAWVNYFFETLFLGAIVIFIFRPTTVRGFYCCHADGSLT
jgi:hypothetical protein